MSLERLPVFVYGTLRPDHGNTWAWDDEAHAAYDGQCWVQDYMLVGSRHAFPYAVRAAGCQTVGALIYPYPQHYEAVLARMDRLESVPHHYERRICVVAGPHPAQLRRAWIYTAAYWQDRLRNPLPTDSDGRYDWTCRHQPTTTERN